MTQNNMIEIRGYIGSGRPLHQLNGVHTYLARIQVAGVDTLTWPESCLISQDPIDIDGHYLPYLEAHLPYLTDSARLPCLVCTTEPCSTCTYYINKRSNRGVTALLFSHPLSTPTVASTVWSTFPYFLLVHNYHHVGFRGRHLRRAPGTRWSYRKETQEPSSSVQVFQTPKGRVSAISTTSSYGGSLGSLLCLPPAWILIQMPTCRKARKTTLQIHTRWRANILTSRTDSGRFSRWPMSRSPHCGAASCRCLKSSARISWRSGWRRCSGWWTSGTWTRC